VQWHSELNAVITSASNALKEQRAAAKGGSSDLGVPPAPPDELPRGSSEAQPAPVQPAAAQRDTSLFVPNPAAWRYAVQEDASHVALSVAPPETRVASGRARRWRKPRSWMRSLRNIERTITVSNQKARS